MRKKPESGFERVKGERRLYRRQYQTATGDWSTLFYGNFVDWKGKRRWFPLGSDLKTARESWRKSAFKTGRRLTSTPRRLSRNQA